MTWVGLPDEENPYYRIDLLDADSPDLRAHSLNYHGNRSVGVDAHDADHVQILRARPMSVSNAIADEWAGPAAHFGLLAVNGYWRAIWSSSPDSPAAGAYRREYLAVAPRARSRAAVKIARVPAAAGPTPASATRTTSPAAEQVRAR
ncbi:Uncharacterised protein [Mycobacteroides abscessus subsp. massiliense]|nr:Uncharacterised protein [Mycobacteroides abscessus subsp. massiliense]